MEQRRRVPTDQCSKLTYCVHTDRDGMQPKMSRGQVMEFHCATQNDARLKLVSCFFWCTWPSWRLIPRPHAYCAGTHCTTEMTPRPQLSICYLQSTVKHGVWNWTSKPRIRTTAAVTVLCYRQHYCHHYDHRKCFVVRHLVSRLVLPGKFN